MSHVYKKVPKQIETLSFVKAVTELGDLWHCSTHLPLKVRHNCPVFTSDELDAADMRMMERGMVPRVRAWDL